SSSDSDTATYATIYRPSPPQPSKSPYGSTPLPRRQSGSESEARPPSSKGLRPSVDVQNTRPPLLSSHNSAPELKVQFGQDGSRSKQYWSISATNSPASTKE